MSIIYSDQVGFTVEIQGWFIACKLINVISYRNGLKDRNHTVILIDTEKAIDKVQHHLILKSPEEIVNLRTVSQTNKGYK